MCLAAHRDEDYYYAFFLFFHVLLMWIHCMPAAGSITVAVHMLDYIDSIF